MLLGKKYTLGTIYSVLGVDMWIKLKKMLDEKQITTYQLSKLTGISEQSFSKLRNGLSKELSFGSMVKIADALDISLDEFR